MKKHHTPVQRELSAIREMDDKELDRVLMDYANHDALAWRRDRKCPTDEETIAAFHEGSLPLVKWLPVWWHTRRCWICRKEVREFREVWKTVDPEQAHFATRARTRRATRIMCVCLASVPFLAYLSYRILVPNGPPASGQQVSKAVPQRSPIGASRGSKTPNRTPASIPTQIALLTNDDVRPPDLPKPPDHIVPRGGERAIIEQETPVNEWVMDPRPKLAWHRRPHLRYEVTILDQDYGPVSHANGLIGTSWTPPKALPTGKLLLWVVSGWVGQTETARSRVAAFKVMDQKTAGRRHLELARCYVSQGLLSSAKHELERIPESSSVFWDAQKLLKKIRVLQSVP